MNCSGNFLHDQGGIVLRRGLGHRRMGSSASNIWKKKLASEGLCVCQAEILECKVESACGDIPFDEVIGGVLR